MAYLISLGRNNISKFILLTILLKLVKDIFFKGINYRNSFTKIKIPWSETQNYLSRHSSIHNLTCFLFTFIMFLIKNYIDTETLFGSFVNKFKKESDNKKYISKYEFLFIIFLWVLDDILNEIYKGMLDLEFWMFGLIFISILSKEYKIHHKISNYLILFLCSLIKIILIFIDVNEEEKNNIVNKDNIWFIPLGIIIYLAIIFIRSYAYVKLKSIMDNKGNSYNEILIFYGLIGTIMNFIVCLVSTFKECDNDFYTNYICKVPYTEDNNVQFNKKYFENFELYFKTLMGEINNKFSIIELFFEIIVIIFGVTFNLFYKFSFLKIIDDLSPGHAIFSYSILKIIPKIILPIITLINEGSFFSSKHEEHILIKYILGFINNIFATIGFAIYLEMIILKFCGFDHDIKENIIRRMKSDLKSVESFYSINDDENEDDEEKEVQRKTF